jgi:glycosyltransferase involved in cell wall biosynthesis
MRILLADQFSELGGAQITLLNLLDEIVRRGWQAKVMAPASGPLHDGCAIRGIPSSRLPLARYTNGRKTAQDVLRYGVDTFCSGLAIRNASKSFHPDLIYVNGPRVLPAAVVAARSKQTPIIFHTHSDCGRGLAHRLVEWCVTQERVRVLAISRFIAQPFGKMASVIHNGVRDHEFVPRPRSQSTCIGIVGRISPQKGHLDFVRAARTMAAARSGLRFVVFGASLFGNNSYEREVRAEATGAPIEFRGWTDDVPAALHEIDILAVPSGPAEGATLVIMEAFSAGTPVVAYPSGGIPELIRHGDTGLLTRAPGHQLLAEELGRLLDSPALMRRLSFRGRIEWATRFRLERFQREICEFIAESFVAPAIADALTATSGIRFAPEKPE